MTIKIPKFVVVKCANCSAKQLAAWGKYGAENSCENCEAAPLALERLSTQTTQ